MQKNPVAFSQSSKMFEKVCVNAPRLFHRINQGGFNECVERLIDAMADVNVRKDLF